MDCYAGCGAPLVDGVCEHCGRIYEEAKPVIIHSMTDAPEGDIDLTLKEIMSGKSYTSKIHHITHQGEDEIVAMRTDFGPSYEPGLMEYDDYPRSFEDSQSTLGVLTVIPILIGVFFSLIGLLPLGLATVVFGLGCALAGGIRQYKHDKEEAHDN